jgi:hypothetical protein
MLQYSGEKKNLLVTVKTSIITHMKDQLKYFIRGTGGSYMKVESPSNSVAIKAVTGRADM